MDSIVQACRPGASDDLAGFAELQAVVASPQECAQGVNK